jgi:hypothetical protein
MLMASLIDAGAPVEPIVAALRDLGLDEVELVVKEVRSAGLRARQVDMMVRGELADSGPWTPMMQIAGRGHHRPYPQIRELIDRAPLSPRVRDGAQRTFRALAEAEAEAHGVEVELVEFHEVGADDAIADIVGVAVGLESLGVERVVVSPVPLGRGLVRGAHGPIPLPGPAALHLLRDAPVVGTDLDGETVTPTGAALLRTHADGFGALPALRLSAVGTGAGHKTWPDRPNVVRALVGEAQPWGTEAAGRVRQFEANLDDMLPQHVPVLVDALLEGGALDAWSTPIAMKKGRPAVTVSALARAEHVEAVRTVFFRHGSTLGVRDFPVERVLLPRELRTVETVYGAVRVKVGQRPDGPSAVPEHEDCLSVARRAGVPVRRVYEAARAAFDAAKEGAP